MTIDPDQREFFQALSHVGLCELDYHRAGSFPQIRPSIFGRFDAFPVVSRPLLVNYFVTGDCPLQCVYCHADDLMRLSKPLESDERTRLEAVARMTESINPMVVVMTGGEPLARPARLDRLIRLFAQRFPVILDTSGVGEFEAVADTIKANAVHVRVSLDCASHMNDRVRPHNPRRTPDRSGSRNGALNVIDRCVQSGIPISVQTVVTRWNEDTLTLQRLRDCLIERGVKAWVLHLACAAGKLRQSSRHLPSANAVEAIRGLLEQTNAASYPIRIRCTSSEAAYRSVLLITPNGDLFTESRDEGKVLLASQGQLKLPLTSLDYAAHARRYLNVGPWN